MMLVRNSSRIFAPSRVNPDLDTHRANRPSTSLYLTMPNTYQPSRAAAFQELFNSHFIANFANPRIPGSRMSEWTLQLPEYLALAPNGAIEYAIRASTMGFYGKMVSDKSIQDAARQAIFRGLESLNCRNGIIDRLFANAHPRD